MSTEKRKELEIYIHIPFCVRKCNYCDFLSGPADEDTKIRYMDALCREIREKSKLYQEYMVSSIFIGGGTPTAVDAEKLCRVIQSIKESYAMKDNAEITMEMNPGTVNKESLRLYKNAGINRVSLGLQSTNNTELQRLGRIHTYEQFCETYGLVREVGFGNVNVDLMSALPGQSTDSFRDSLERILSLHPQPDHISAYSLIVEEGTPLYEEYEKDLLDLPSEDAEREMYHLTKTILKEYGYERYEISNYAKPGKECVHNLGYWQRKNYVGFGIGAASLIENRRFANDSNLEDYIKNPCERVINQQELSISEQMEEFLFLGLRMSKGVSLTQFEDNFGVTMGQVYGPVMERHMKSGLLEKAMEDNQEYLRLNDAGMDVSNYVMADFLEPEWTTQ